MEPVETTGTTDTFFQFPFPSDARMKTGFPDLQGYPSGGSPIIKRTLETAEENRGWPLGAVTYFQFSAPVTSYQSFEPLAMDTSAPAYLIDIDSASADRGTLLPITVTTLSRDNYLPDNVIAVAPMPGIVLRPQTSYAVVITTALSDANGARIGASPLWSSVANNQGEEKWRNLYSPLLTTLDQFNIDKKNIAAATVFTTGHPVQAMSDLYSAVRSNFSTAITGLQVVDTNKGYCELVGDIVFPQFQAGTPPFDTEGLFTLDSSGLPIEQREETAVARIVLPLEEMPTDGFPLMIYMHGSGGQTSAMVDLGPVTIAGGTPQAGKGPAWVVANQFSMAAAAASLPLSPERNPTLDWLAYLNFSNLPAFRDTFRQGALEQGLFFDALQTLRIPSSIVAECEAKGLSKNTTDYTFAAQNLGVLGQSMGAVYLNMVSAIDHRVRAVVPTGAGGMWPKMVLETQSIPNIQTILSLFLNVKEDLLTFVHPSLQTLNYSWQAAEPLYYMPYVANKALSGKTPAHIFEPVGKGDEFFSEGILNAAALAYNNQKAGPTVWPSLQENLTFALQQIGTDLPVQNNRQSIDGTPYTGAVVQYESDGLVNGHYIVFQLEELQFQYGCFLAQALNGIAPTIVTKQPLGSACPGI